MMKIDLVNEISCKNNSTEKISKILLCEDCLLPDKITISEALEFFEKRYEIQSYIFDLVNEEGEIIYTSTPYDYEDLPVDIVDGTFSAYSTITLHRYENYLLDRYVTDAYFKVPYEEFYNDIEEMLNDYQNAIEDLRCIRGDYKQWEEEQCSSDSEQVNENGEKEKK